VSPNIKAKGGAKRARRTPPAPKGETRAQQPSVNVETFLRQVGCWGRVPGQVEVAGNKEVKMCSGWEKRQALCFRWRAFPAERGWRQRGIKALHQQKGNGGIAGCRDWGISDWRLGFRVLVFGFSFGIWDFSFWDLFIGVSFWSFVLVFWILLELGMVCCSFMA